MTQGRSIRLVPLGLVGCFVAMIAVSCAKKEETNTAQTTPDTTAQLLAFEGESHLTNIKQLTDEGQNAEAYFSHDGTELILQSSHGDMQCDQIFRMNVDGTNMRMVSTGKGATTCSFIAPDGKSIIYASTHLGGDSCPPKPDFSRGYVWALYKSYDIFAADPDGANIRRLTDAPGYDAEGVYSPQGDKIIFTSARDGDLELYTMNPDGSNQKRLTNTPGYDGGAFFSYDGKKICWRASRPTGDTLQEYYALLKDGLIRPNKLEIYIADADGKNVQQLTSNGKANFGPYWHPSGEFIIFASNMDDANSRNFDLYTVNVTTKAIERITYNETFDGFPMFTHDGKRLVFASNRHNNIEGETNIFICDWK